MSVFECGASRLAMILVEKNVAKAAIVFQVEHAIAIGPEDFFHAFFADRGEGEVVIGSLDDHFVRAHAVHAVEQAIAFAIEPPFDAESGEFVGNYAKRPARCIFATSIAAVGEDFRWSLPFAARTKRAMRRAFYLHALTNEVHGAIGAIRGNDDPAPRDGIFAKFRQA